MSLTYKHAGVDIDAGNEAVQRIRESAASTFTPGVLTGLGSFGAFFDLSEVLRTYRRPVLVQSVDGVGTKIIIARRAHDFSRIGEDLVSACSNDIAVHGAKPLTMLDYIAQDRLNPDTVQQIVQGIARGCREIQAALIGGETAEMPGTYLPGEHDLVGLVTGIVDGDRIINGSDVSPGSTLIGVHSSGLHTNGYSLARAAIDRCGCSLSDAVEGSSEPLGELLLKAHLNYTPGILRALENGIPIQGMAHITGGGLPENVPRMLPPGCRAVIDCTSWDVPPIFTHLRRLGDIPRDEMFRTFNMGIGLVIASEDPHAADRLAECFSLPCSVIGRIESGTEAVRLLHREEQP